MQVLQLYRDPKTFSLKNLIYTTEQERSDPVVWEPSEFPIYP